jgi:hypothetical protein
MLTPLASKIRRPGRPSNPAGRRLSGVEALLAEHNYGVAAEDLTILASRDPVEVRAPRSGGVVRGTQRYLLVFAGDVDTRLVKEASRRSQAERFCDASHSGVVMGSAATSQARTSRHS